MKFGKLHTTKTTLPETTLGAEGIHYDYQAVRAAANILRDCRIETECFLTSKKAMVAIGVGGRTAKQGIVMLAGLGGAAVGSIVPVAGTFAGGYIAATAASEALPGYNLSPNTDPGELIRAKAEDSMLGKWSAREIYGNEVRDLVIDQVGKQVVNSSLDAAGHSALPASVPFSWMYQNAKDLYKAKTTTKPDVVRDLSLGVAHAEQVIARLDAKIRKAFRERGRIRQYHDIFLLPSGPKELGVEVLDHPTNPAHWVRLSRYELHRRNALAELEKLKRLVSHAACRQLVSPQQTAI